MKRSYQDVGWLFDTNGVMVGLSLGFDRRAEHVQGISPLLGLLGVELPEYPIGLVDRQVNPALPGLRYLPYVSRPRLSNRRSYPAALLLLTEPSVAPGEPELELARRFDVEFFHDPTHRLSLPEHDVVAAWGASGFAVHARGQANLALLQQLQDALLARDVAVLEPPRLTGSPGPMKLLRMSRLTPEDHAHLVERDLTTRELARAVDATGLIGQLEAAGCTYRTLTPAWFDDAKDEVIFYLDTNQPKLFNTGWFSLEELQQWAAGSGPVVRDIWLEQRVQWRLIGDWQSRLFQGLAAFGAEPRYGVQLVWMDERKLIPGIRYRATRETEDIMPSGNYEFLPLMARYVDRMETGERRRA